MKRDVYLTLVKVLVLPLSTSFRKNFHWEVEQHLKTVSWIRSLGWDGPLEKGKATHSSIQAWRIPWTVESMGSQTAGHD